MTDHPFDEIAVNFALEAVKAIIDRQANTLEDITDLIAPTALTAACNSMKERGKARDGTSLKSGWEEGGVFLAMQPFPEGAKVEKTPVTIFRHGE